MNIALVVSCFVIPPCMFFLIAKGMDKIWENFKK
jgi:hypothetical protein